MDDTSTDQPEMDELQKSLDESAKKTPIKITVDDHDDTSEAVPEAATTPHPEVDQALAEDGLTDASLQPNEESTDEKEQSTSATDGENEEPLEAKRVGPEGPYKPAISGGDEESITIDTEEEVIDDSLLDSMDIENDTDSETQDDSTDTVLSAQEDVDRKVDEMLSVEKLEPVAAQAAANAAAKQASEESNKSFNAKVKRFFSGWWHNKKARYATILGVFVLMVGVIFIPFTRYATLNLFGVRVSSSLIVVDSDTRLPLENIPVSLGGQSLRTDEQGRASFDGVKLGTNRLIISKLGYAEYEKNLTLGFGSNPLGEQPLMATGAQYSFSVVDWLSENSIVEAEALSGEDVAKADEEGRIILTVGDLSEDAEIKISADGYREEYFRISDIDQESQTVKMVPAKKHVFVSNRDGQYDLYKIDLDGKNEELLIEATGKEREIPFVLPHQERDIVAYISSRDGETNRDNFILDGLFVVNVVDGELKRVARSEQLQIIGWADSKLIYLAVVEGVSAGNPARSKIFSYDVGSGERIELASSNYFNDVELVADTLYYSVSGYAVPTSQAKLFSISTNGENKTTVVDAQVWSIVRQDFTTLLYNSADRQWFEQEVGQQVTELDVQPASVDSRKFSVSPDGSKALWVEVRDGKGTLLRYDISSGEETVILSQPGLTDPVHWMNNEYVVYRVDTVSETADFVMNVQATDVTKKISDVLGNRSRYFY